MPELKPCPFCGGKAKIRYDKDTNCISVECSYCNAKIDGYYVYHRHREGSFGATKKKAVEAWNRRVTIAE